MALPKRRLAPDPLWRHQKEQEARDNERGARVASASSAKMHRTFHERADNAISRP